MRAMLRILLIGATLPGLAALAGGTPAYGQEPCANDSQWMVPGVLADRGLHTSGTQGWKMAPAQVTTVTTQAKALLDLLKRFDFVTDPVGMQVGVYRAIGTPAPGTFTLEEQPYPIHAEAMFFPFVCRNGTIARRWTDASGGLSVDVNSLFEILDKTGETINGREVYALHPDLGEYRGHRMFMPYSWAIANQPRAKTAGSYDRSVLVARQGALPFTHVTRKELVDQWRATTQAKLPVEVSRAMTYATIRPPEEQEAEKRRGLEAIQKLNISEASKQTRTARFLTDYRTDEQRRDETVAKVKATFEATLKTVDDVERRYDAAALGAPAVIPAGSSASSPTTLDTNPAVDLTTDCYPKCAALGQYLVTINEAYYDKRLPKTAVQFFVVNLGWAAGANGNAMWLRLKDEGLAKFDFDALVAMLGK